MKTYEITISECRSGGRKQTTVHRGVDLRAVMGEAMAEFTGYSDPTWHPEHGLNTGSRLFGQIGHKTGQGEQYSMDTRRVYIDVNETGRQ